MSGLSGRARGALLRDGCKSMVGSDDDVRRFGKPEFGKRGTEPAKIVIGVANCRKGSRAIDSGLECQEAVALVVLRAVRIARPEHQKKGLAPCGEQRQHRARRNRSKIVLLD